MHVKPSVVFSCLYDFQFVAVQIDASMHSENQVCHAGDLQQYPAALGYDAREHCAWLDAMWSTVEEKLKAGISLEEGIVLETLEDVPQSILAEVVQSLYTGHLSYNEDTIQGLLQAADYLQVSTAARTGSCIS